MGPGRVPRGVDLRKRRRESLGSANVTSLGGRRRRRVADGAGPDAEKWHREASARAGLSGVSWLALRVTAIGLSYPHTLCRCRVTAVASELAGADGAPFAFGLDLDLCAPQLPCALPPKRLVQQGSVIGCAPLPPLGCFHQALLQPNRPLAHTTPPTNTHTSNQNTAETPTLNLALSWTDVSLELRHHCGEQRAFERLARAGRVARLDRSLFIKDEHCDHKQSVRNTSSPHKQRQIACVIRVN